MSRRLTASSSLVPLLFSLLSMSCASGSGARSSSDGPLLAPVSSALVQKVTRCQTSADCGAAPAASVGYLCQHNKCELVSAARIAAASASDSGAQAQAADAAEITPADAIATPAGDGAQPADAIPGDAPLPASDETPAAVTPADPPTQPGDTTAVERPIKDEAEPYPGPRS
jgi:hypothetical protein